MLSTEEYIKSSVSCSLFWLRIMGEHAVFLEAAFPAPARRLAAQADRFVRGYERLLLETVRGAGGILPEETLKSGQFYTKFTEGAELAVQKDFAIRVNRGITRAEYNLVPRGTGPGETKKQTVSQLNQRALSLTNEFIRFQSDILNRQASCELFSFLYTSCLEHILREAMRYADLLNGLQAGDNRAFRGYVDFWNQNMSDHAKAMRGLFDPKAADRFTSAEAFVRLYDELLSEGPGRNAEASGSDFADARSLAEFQADTTQAILDCKVRSLMSPLYTDHLLREANHYAYLIRNGK